MILLTIIPALGLFVLALFFMGVLPIPVGYERGKVKWLMWCGTGMHAHIVYWHGDSEGRSERNSFQSIHPDDLSERQA